MSEIKFDKTKILAEETEKRVFALENKMVTKNNVVSITESETIKIIASDTIDKCFEFYCKEQTGVVLTLSIFVDPIVSGQCRIFFNDKAYIQKQTLYQQ